jgi:large subunit ribosomal protein L18
MKIVTKEDRRHRIRLRLRKRIHGDVERPRLSVFKSGAHMYVQVVDDARGETIAAASTVEPAVKAAMSGAVRPGNRAGAELVGRTIAERLLAKGITKVVFDRGGYLYHGRVRAVADAARQAGLEF